MADSTESPSKAELRKKITAIIGFPSTEHIYGTDQTRKFYVADQGQLEAIMEAVEQAFQAQRSAVIREAMERLPVNRKLYEPVTKREVGPGGSATMDLGKDQKGTLVFVQDNGYNQAVDELRAALQAMLNTPTEGDKWMSKDFKEIIQGWVYTDSYGALTLSQKENDRYGQSVAELFEEYAGKSLAVSYYITDKQVSTDEAMSASIVKDLGGEIDAEFVLDAYSEWTVMEFKEKAIVGGHDLVQELETYEGKYCTLVLSKVGGLDD